MPKQPQQPQVKLERIDSRNGVYSTHANNINTLWTPHDVRFIFGELVRISEDPKTQDRTFIIEDRVAVTMAWSEVKFFAATLNDIVVKFEQKNGQIKIPEV